MIDLSIFIVVLLTLLPLTLWISDKASDPYGHGLFHLTLNRLPHDDPACSPRTEWLNMGYWKVGQTPVGKTVFMIFIFLRTRKRFQRLVKVCSHCALYVV